MKRESAGKPVKAFEIWSESVAEITVGDEQAPKVMSPEV
jgi:hypothetical protein